MLKKLPNQFVIMKRFGIILLTQTSDETHLRTNCLPKIFSKMVDCISVVTQLDKCVKPLFFKILNNKEIVDEILSSTKNCDFGFLHLNEDMDVICVSSELNKDLVEVVKQATDIRESSDTTGYFKVLNEEEIVHELHVSYD